ncbi:MAG: hypothetical protein AB8G22_24615 [Saprospiraceae bacterium]
MKNLMFKSFLLACLVLTTMAMSCSKSIDLPNDGFSVVLKADYSGTISDGATIEYRDEDNKLQSIPLTKNWRKTFQVDAGFNFYFHVTGEVKGKLNVSSVITGTEIERKNSEFEYQEMTAFDVLREEVL